MPPRARQNSSRTQVHRRALFSFVGFEMTRGCFNSKMAGRAFSNTRHRRSQIIGSAWQRLFRPARHQRLHSRSTGHQTPLSFFDTNVLRDTRAQQRKRRYQHPEPPPRSNRSRKRNRDDEKRDADEYVFEGHVERQFSFPSAIALSRTIGAGWWFWM